MIGNKGALLILVATLLLLVEWKLGVLDDVISRIRPSSTVLLLWWWWWCLLESTNLIFRNFASAGMPADTHCWTFGRGRDKTILSTGILEGPTVCVRDDSLLQTELPRTTHALYSTTKIFNSIFTDERKNERKWTNKRERGTSIPPSSSKIVVIPSIDAAPPPSTGSCCLS